jgi:hypothetical protein
LVSNNRTNIPNNKNSVSPSAKYNNFMGAGTGANKGND